MRDKDTPSVSPEVAIMDSVARAELTEIAVDFAELTIDALLDDELLQAIPIVGTVARLYRSSVSIRDRLFLRKVLGFLKEFDDIPKEDRERFVEELDASEGTRAKAGAALMLLLDRLDDVDKPQLIGRLYRAKLEQRLSFEELRRFCMIVERSHLPDIVKLSRLPAGERVEPLAAPYLHALGLVSITGEDYGTVDGIGAATWYELNELGRRFLDLALLPDDA